jgi:hypothetical protein
MSYRAVFCRVAAFTFATFLTVTIAAQTSFTLTIAEDKDTKVVIGDPTGVADSSQGFVDAHTRCPTAGCEIIVPCGTYRLSPSTFTISKIGVTLRGINQSCSVIKRHTDTNGVVINVSGHGFQLRDLRIEDFAYGATNTGTSVQLININEVIVDNVWMQTGYNLLKSSHGNNHSYTNVTVESMRRAGIWILQTADVSITASRAYAAGIIGGPATAASILIEKDPTYPYRPSQINITGNNFPFTNRGSHIRASEVEGLVIADNDLSQAGRYEPNTFDEITIIDSSDFTISGNTSVMGLNTHIEGSRATRYVVNVDAASDRGKIGPNAFLVGMSGSSVSNASADTIVFATDDTLDEAVPVRGMKLQSFCLELTNTAGTLQHRYLSECNGAAMLGNFASKVVGASGVLANTPTLSSTVDFVAGGGLGSGSNTFYVNTAAQIVGDQIFGGCAIERDTTASAFDTCDWRLTNVNVNGVTRQRLTLMLWDQATGAAAIISTSTIGAGAAVRVKFTGYLR